MLVGHRKRGGRSADSPSYRNPYLFARRTTRFELILDAPHAAVFHDLSKLRNVLLVATPVAPDGGSFTDLTGASENGALIANNVNPLHLLQLTDQVSFGLDQVIDNPLEVSQMQTLAQAGKLPSALAFLLARAFGLGAPVDFATNVGAGAPPVVETQGFTLPPPPQTPPTVTAAPDSYSATGNAILAVPAPNGVLANDGDSANYPLSVDQLNGAGGTLPLHGTSVDGAAVSINADGSFTYDPTSSSKLKALVTGQSTADSFTYRANDGHGGTATGLVTFTVSGAGHEAPALSGIEPNPLQYDAGTAARAITSSLAIVAPTDATLAGATVSITSGLVSSEDSLSFGAQNGITGFYDPGTGVLTMTGTASVADYQAALRSVTYEDPNGSTPTTRTRTIGFQVDDGNASNHLSNVVSRSVLVSANPPPTATDDAASTDKNTAIDINVLANDSDSDRDTLSVASVNTAGTEGAVSINPNGTIHYDPNGRFATLQQGQTATDTFTYQATDGFHDSTSATVTVTIAGVNSTPLLSNIESSTLQYTTGTPTQQVTQSLTITNTHGATLAGATVQITSGLNPSEDSLGFTNQNGVTGSYDSSAGVLTLSGTDSVADYQTALRSVTYSDSNGSNPTAGTRTISFQVDDGASSNNLSNTVSRNVELNPNSPPVAGDVSAVTDKHTAIDINVLAAASDPDDDPVSLVGVNTAGTLGAVSINPNGSIHYDPNGQFNGLSQGQSATDTFGYSVTDGFFTVSATVTVTINGVDDPPAISNIETTPASYRAQDPAIPVTSTLAISDDDDSTISGATASITSGFSNANDLLLFTNQNGITGSYNSSTGVLTLNGDATLASYQAALRSVEFSSSDGSTSPDARTVSFTATDSLGATSTPVSRVIAVGEANQPPVANNVDYDAVGNTPLGVGASPTAPSVTVNDNLLNHASDPDGGSVTLTGNSSPGHGTLTLNPDGTFTYVPDAGFSGNDSFTYTVTDTDDPSNPKSATATVTITVGPVVWYVDNTKAAGNGTSSNPFNNLAGANAAAGASSIVFLYHGSGSYTGGIALHSGEDLFGQPHGLTVDGNSLVPAGGSTPTVTNSGGDGIDLAENSDVEGVNVSGTSGNGIAASGVNDATVGGASAGAPVAISGAGGDGIHISGGNGTLDFTKASVSGSTDHSVSVSDRTGGIATFGGTISDTGTGISLTSNSGATINLSGEITASTGASTAFAATGGGTVSATGSGSTVTTTTATALNVSSTTIGAAGLNFQSISSNGANPGINLSSTGASGGLTVTGTGTAGSGGTIQASSGEGVELSSTASPSFTDVDIKNNAADGINGSQVSGLTIAGSTVSDNGTQANVSGENDDGLDFSPNGTGSPNGLTGTVSVTNSTITGSADNNAIISDTSGTLNLTVAGSAFTSNNATTGNDGLHIDANGTTNATVSITGSTFTNNFGDHFQFSTDSASSGTDSVTFSSNTLNTTATGVLGGGVVISPFGNSHTTLTANSNNIQKSVFTGIAIDEDGITGTLSGTVNGNTVGTPATANSGSEGNDIGIFAEGSVAETLAITNNNLFQYANEAGIGFLDREGSPTMNLTITGNTIADPGSFGSWGLLGQAGAASGDAGRVCAAISGNSMTGSAQAGQGGADFELDQEFNTTIDLPGYSGGTQNTNAVVSFVQGANNSSGAPAGIATTSGSGGGFTGTGTSCP